MNIRLTSFQHLENVGNMSYQMSSTCKPNCHPCLAEQMMTSLILTTKACLELSWTLHHLLTHHLLICLHHLLHCLATLLLIGLHHLCHLPTLHIISLYHPLHCHSLQHDLDLFCSTQSICSPFPGSDYSYTCTHDQSLAFGVGCDCRSIIWTWNQPAIPSIECGITAKIAGQDWRHIDMWGEHHIRYSHGSGLDKWGEHDVRCSHIFRLKHGATCAILDIRFPCVIHKWQWDQRDCETECISRHTSFITQPSPEWRCWAHGQIFLLKPGTENTWDWGTT